MKFTSIFKEGKITTISGFMGSGKTDFAMLLSYIAKLKGYNVASNIQNNITDFVNTDIALLKFILQHGKNVIVLDEANLFSSSKRAMSKTALQLEALLSIIRKLRASIIFIIQRYYNFLPFIREMQYVTIMKLDEYNAIITVNDMQFKITDIPSCKIYNVDFDSYAFSSFHFKIDLQKLLQDISDLPYHEAIAKMKEYAKNDFADFLLEKQKTKRKRGEKKKG